MDYLMKVKEYSLPEAVELLVGRDAVVEPPTSEYKYPTKPERKLLMPELTDKPYLAKKYLRREVSIRRLFSIALITVCFLKQQNIIMLYL